VVGVVDPTKLVFVDECGTHTSLAPVYGYCPKGERLRLYPKTAKLSRM
jgi:hypothetical protein